ncbi:four helix bundle protein [bacterium]|nr:four helix bundle protein [bacterium]
MDQNRNLNRGYRKLIVWQDSLQYYVLTCEIVRALPYELRRVASQQIACVDSVHRNIAEGYCRRSIREYLQFLSIALASAGESVSGWHALKEAGQITGEQFGAADAAAYKLENGLLRLTASLQHKRDTGEWSDNLILHESNAAYGGPDND